MTETPEQPGSFSDSTGSVIDPWDEFFDTIVSAVARSLAFTFTGQVRRSVRGIKMSDTVRVPLARRAVLMRIASRATFAVALTMTLLFLFFNPMLAEGSRGLVGQVLLTALLCYLCSLALATAGANAVRSLGYLASEPIK